MEHSSEDWVTLRSAARRHPMVELGLVLTALDLDNEVVKRDGEWCLRVPESQVFAAQDELAAYLSENPPAGAEARAIPDLESGWNGVFGYLSVIWGVMLLEQISALDRVWRAAGRMEAGLVTAGEWWRTVTALTLHLDLGHIAANSAFGAFFGLFAGRALGSGWAWLTILMGGAAGNALNAWLQTPDHRAVGASTAVSSAKRP